MTTTSFTYHEIMTQTAAWQNALDAIQSRRSALLDLAGGAYRQVLFTGCGSTYYLSLAGSALFQELTGRISRAVPGGELLLNSQTVLSAEAALLVAVSRSGTTTETIKAVERFKSEQRGRVIAITNYDDTPLTSLADISIVIPEGREESVAQTRSFASMYVAATALCALAGGRDDLLAGMSALPGTGERLLRQYETLAQETGERLDLDRFYFLGSGLRYGLACEVNLKMKEMTLTDSEPFHFLEFRHGPMAMASEKALVVGLVSDQNYPHETAVLDEMRRLGANLLTLGEASAGVVFGSGVPEAVRGVLYLPVLQLMALYRAHAKGLNPDRPTNLTSVIKLNL
jgi:glucosamine--fructose-6-phosphate aminotransferase (isomerizing)